MLIIMNLDAGRNRIDGVVRKIRELGLVPHEIPGERRIAIGITGNRSKLDPDLFLNLPGVIEAIAVSRPYKLVSREMKRENTVIGFGDDTVGGNEIALIAGPCSVESREQIIDMAWTLRELGVRFLRGGAFKPRTSPYAFRGLREKALEFLAEARALTGMHIVTEVMETGSVTEVAAAADIIQIGARNMQNYPLLEAVGRASRPVLLKRGMAATIEEFLMAAEYIVSAGNYNVILCERGIRTFEPSTRFTLDLNAVPVVKKASHLPIIVDPSHGTGAWDCVPDMALAAIAAGADGLIIETHAHPENALSDGYQSLKPAKLAGLIERLGAMSAVLGRSFLPAHQPGGILR
ncbi:MAG TPA: 3-deoxy-7-phosphoheptulonate synthase [Bacteroidota bacterium]|nr:3-deoxy-7-phosphoheptulonate synthase [Bacteroidota bacterium]